MMPELGKRLVHEEGLKLIREWIAAMPDADVQPECAWALARPMRHAISGFFRHRLGASGVADYNPVGNSSVRVRFVIWSTTETNWDSRETSAGIEDTCASRPGLRSAGGSPDRPGRP